MKYGQYKFNRGAYSTADLEEGASAVTANSSVASVSAVRVRTSGAVSAGVTVVTSVANLEAVVQAQLSVASSTSCAAEKIKLSSASATAASTISSAGQRVRLGLMTDSFAIYGISTVVSDSELIMLASAAVTSSSSLSAPRGGFKHTVNVSDINSSAAIASSGRRKWELIAEGTKVWTEIAA
tara:strand:- start:2560 stop:3105 length:546 start_codon:yes stop_codon:yes gene_type:complete